MTRRLSSIQVLWWRQAERFQTGQAVAGGPDGDAPGAGEVAVVGVVGQGDEVHEGGLIAGAESAMVVEGYGEIDHVGPNPTMTLVANSSVGGFLLHRGLHLARTPAYRPPTGIRHQCQQSCCQGQTERPTSRSGGETRNETAQRETSAPENGTNPSDFVAPDRNAKSPTISMRASSAEKVDT
jgi:hypothetical protein